jgi:excisionase family DNA binding protein
VDILTIEEAAELLHTTTDAIYQHRSRGDGPRAAKVGRRLLFRRSEIEAWFEAHLEPINTKDRKKERSGGRAKKAATAA